MATDNDFVAPSEKKKELDAQDHALTPDEKVDIGSEDSMDASDPPSASAPGDHGDPVPSSGFHDDDKGSNDSAK